MPHQSPDTTKAAAQNTVTGHQPAEQTGAKGGREPEARAYAAPSVEQSTLAPPAAGEVDTFMDEGDPSFGAQQGANHTNWELHAKNLQANQQGAKTRQANKRIVSGREP